MNSNDKIAESLNGLAQIIQDETDWDMEDVFLYAEFEPGVVYAGTYKEFSDRVVCHEPQDELFDALSGLWSEADADKRWSSLSYVIAGGKFDAGFEYPEQWDETESYHDRLSRILLRRYGAKPIEYPPLPGMDGSRAP